MNLADLKSKATASELCLIEKTLELADEEAAEQVLNKAYAFIQHAMNSRQFEFRAFDMRGFTDGLLAAIKKKEPAKQ